jgi:uncharacterized protein (TIGR02266 family)
LTDERREDREVTPLRCWCESGDVTLYARVGAVSEDAIFLRTRTPFVVGSRVKVRFPAHGLNPPEFVGSVAWVREEGSEGRAGMQLSLDRLDSEKLALIHRIIEGERR